MNILAANWHLVIGVFLFYKVNSPTPNMTQLVYFHSSFLKMWPVHNLIFPELDFMQNMVYSPLVKAGLLPSATSHPWHFNDHSYLLRNLH